MGSKYLVEAWESADGHSHYYWLEIYRGSSMIKAVYYLLWAGWHGWKCIKFEWRP